MENKEKAEVESGQSVFLTKDVCENIYRCLKNRGYVQSDAFEEMIRHIYKNSSCNYGST